jgi:hypothetical protein
MTHRPDLTRRTFLAAAGFFGVGCMIPSAFAQEGEAAAPAPSGEAVSFPWENEELYYKVKVNGSEAAHAVLRLGQLRMLKGNTPYVALAATVKSVGLFHSVYPMNDRANTFIHAGTLQPLRSEKIIQEAGKERSYKVDYKPEQYAAHVEQTRDKKERTYITPVPGAIHDAFTWFLHLRRREDLAVGLKADYFIYDGWKLSRVGLHVVGEESVLTPLGWVKAWKIALEREILRSAFDLGDGKDKEKNKMVVRPPILKITTPAKPTGTLWLSQDARRLPAKLFMDAGYGSGEVMLARHVASNK